MFFAGLGRVAPKAGQGSYGFLDAERNTIGWAQFIVVSDRAVTLHRLWVIKPSRGSGSMMLRTLCLLADAHDIEVQLKAIPFGRKPHLFSKKQLADWYRKHGFAGTPGKMIRIPVSQPAPSPQYA